MRDPRRPPCGEFQHAFGAAVLSVVMTVLANGQGFPIWQVAAPSPTADAFGSAVAIVGDLTGDGMPEVLVGAKSHISLFSPSPITYALLLSGANGSLVTYFLGASTTDRFGAAAAALGDVNGDAVPDFAIGAPGQGGSSSPSVGLVHVYSGATFGLLYTITAAVPGDALGESLARVGDLNGDGVGDIVAGAPGANNHLGRAYAFSGANGALLQTFVPPPFQFRFGASVSGAGDVSGDGVADVVIGAPANVTPFDMVPGNAFVYSGLGGPPLLTLTAGVTADRFGISVAGLGDVDGDNVPDVVVGASFVDNLPGVGSPGFAQIRSGAGGTIIRVLNPITGGGFGSCLANAGDIDGDGIAEVLVGRPPVIEVFSSSSGAHLASLGGASASVILGSSVAGGDLNGDGVPDVVAGAPASALTQTLGHAVARSVIGVGTGLVRYGTACPGTAGFSPSIAAAGGPPTVGNATFGFAVTRGLGGSIAVLFATTVPVAGGFPVGGGCSAYLGGPVVTVPTPIILSGPTGLGGAGHGLLSTPVPAIPGLLGAQFFLEWAVLDAGSPTGSVALSDAIAITIL